MRVWRLKRWKRKTRWWRLKWRKSFHQQSFIWIKTVYFCFHDVLPSHFIWFWVVIWQSKGKSDETAAAKKRKTEWASALKSMPGDVSFAQDRFCFWDVQRNIHWIKFNIILFGGQDILSYLSLYVEPAYAGASLSTAHPVDLVLDAFKDPEVSKTTMHKLAVFLDELMSAHGKTCEFAAAPVPYFCFIVQFVFLCGEPGFDALPWWCLILAQLDASAKDVSKIVGQGDDKRLVVRVPLSSIMILRPADMPCIEDWITCCVSFLFSGNRLYREPLDLNVQNVGGTESLSEPFLLIKKGFTRLMLGFWMVGVIFFSQITPRSCISHWHAVKLRTAAVFLLLVAADLDPISGKESMWFSSTFFGNMFWNSLRQVVVVGCFSRICCCACCQPLESCSTCQAPSRLAQILRLWTSRGFNLAPRERNVREKMQLIWNYVFNLKQMGIVNIGYQKMLRHSRWQLVLRRCWRRGCRRKLPKIRMTARCCRPLSAATTHIGQMQRFESGRSAPTSFRRFGASLLGLMRFPGACCGPTWITTSGKKVVLALVVGRLLVSMGEFLFFSLA